MPSAVGGGTVTGAELVRTSGTILTGLFLLRCVPADGPASPADYVSICDGVEGCIEFCQAAELRKSKACDGDAECVAAVQRTVSNNCATGWAGNSARTATGRPTMQEKTESFTSCVKRQSRDCRKTCSEIHEDDTKAVTTDCKQRCTMAAPNVCGRSLADGCRTAEDRSECEERLSLEVERVDPALASRLFPKDSGPVAAERPAKKPGGGSSLQLPQAGFRRTGKVLSGTWSDQQTRMEVGYSAGTFQGRFREFQRANDNKVNSRECVAVEGQFKNGLREGKWTEYDELCARRAEAEWKGGVLHGKVTLWSEDGRGGRVKTRETEFRSGVLDGKVREWALYSCGAPLASEAEYRMGQECGWNRVWSYSAGKPCASRFLLSKDFRGDCAKVTPATRPDPVAPCATSWASHLPEARPAIEACVSTFGVGGQSYSVEALLDSTEVDSVVTRVSISTSAGGTSADLEMCVTEMLIARPFENRPSSFNATGSVKTCIARLAVP